MSRLISHILMTATIMLLQYPLCIERICAWKARQIYGLVYLDVFYIVKIWIKILGNT
jgi:hypothetical protein